MTYCNFVIPIIGPSILEAQKQIQEAEKLGVAIEIRSDLIQGNIVSLLENINVECIVKISDLSFLDQKEIKADYLDIDISHVKDLKQIPLHKIIVSYHDFEKTPYDLEALLEYLKKEAPFAYLYKIATKANSTLDAMRGALFLKEMHSRGERLLFVAMGEEGHLTRILGPKLQNPFTFVALCDSLKSAPCQLTYDELVNLYALKKQTPYTKVFALIGEPVKQSQGAIKHNKDFQNKGFNAVYLKLKVFPEELPLFIHFAKLLPIEAMAVTMPLKKSILPLIEAPPNLLSINTLKLTQTGYKGYNTDCSALVDLLEKRGSLKGKKVDILGSGGVGLMVAKTLNEMGANVTIFSRQITNKKPLLDNLKVTIKDLITYEGGSDILIQATSCGMYPMIMESPIDPLWIKSCKLLVEFIYTPVETRLIQEAKRHQIDFIDGYTLFETVSNQQQKIWNCEAACHCNCC